nr:unnamed protein product [Callosobruchus chinensis]
MIVRKKVPSPEPVQVEAIRSDAPKAASHEASDDIDSVVAEVVDNLITYVEIKELAPSLIKQDEYDFTEQLPAENNKAPSVDGHFNVMKRSHKKRSRIDSELIRLSCKIVNVEVEKEDEVKHCSKPFCRLGCVCNSLRCENTMILHCQKEKCMWSCTCPKERLPSHEHIVTLPAGTNVLSTETVSKIEDQAKKHLARVEREFTQTIIQTNNRTIVVGASGRLKTRRASQAPKKYTDYVENFDEYDAPNVKVNWSKKCQVTVTRLNLDAIIPFCLQHNLYDCFCKFRSEYLPKDHPQFRTLGTNTKASAPFVKQRQLSPAKSKPRKRANEDVADHHHLPKKRAVGHTDPTTKGYKTADAGKQSVENKESGLSGNGPAGESDSAERNRPAWNKKWKKGEFDCALDPDGTCARAMGVKGRKTNRINADSVLKKDFVYTYRDSDLLRIKLNHAQKKRYVEILDSLRRNFSVRH